MCVVNWSLVIFPLLPLALCELFTALEDLKQLIETEKVYVKSLESYIYAEQQNLDLLRRYKTLYENQLRAALNDVDLFITNPINAYVLIKRLTEDWKQVETLLKRHIGAEYLAKIASYKPYIKIPTDEDLQGATAALNRLQDIYKLDVSSIAKGEINGVKYDTELNVADCLELGRQSYNDDDFYHAQLWLTEADSRFNGKQTTERINILEYLANSAFKQGNISFGLQVTSKLLKISPSHQQAKQNKEHYENQTRSNQEKRDEKMKYPHLQNTLYAKLCRGEINAPDNIISELKCRFLNHNDPYLMLAPFKVEEAYKYPVILIFHDVMSEAEIETIKTVANPFLHTSGVVNIKTGNREVVKYRTSKTTWLSDEIHKHIADISQRVTHMTNLSIISAEPLQVVNYGIGGHYDIHHDFIKSGDDLSQLHLMNGNRIATVLFYMSDVIQGGATVFPILKTAIQPKKGTAVFWYNLFPSGEGIASTLHAACPVLVGTKWVCNKWLREYGQEFRRPCGLSPASPNLTALDELLKYNV